MSERRVAVVSGASRGVGKGVALALGEAGFAVYVTGRTTVEGSAPLPGTIGATAQEVARRGGEGVAVRCDHRDDAQVEALFARVAAERGRLDLLVNNVFAVPDEVLQPGSFWEKPLHLWDMVDVGLRTSYVASVFAARLMVPRRQGLIVNISGFGARAYVHGVAYGVSKAGADKMARDMARELRRHGVAALSLWLGLVGTERTRRALQEHPRLFAGLVPESQEFPGRVIRALALDPDVLRHSGRVLVAAELAREYGVLDVDGSQPASLRESLGGPAD
jgi:NAD(P)-dependent dehydrogenase (short-subunit alcohol dehydrogenase family)